MISQSAPVVATLNRGSSEPDLSPTRLRRVFSGFPSGVVFLSAVIDGEPVGMVMSSFTSVSLDPPLVSVCVKNDSETWPKLSSADLLGLSIFSAGQATHCRQLSGRAASRFANIPIEVVSAGQVFLRDASVRMSCRIEETILAGDHEIVLMSIIDTFIADGVAPLIFFNSAFRGLPELA